ncbi:MAG TPA: hypothetical protein VFR81_28830 [Longimicrobium sp.]|nr:hypothetical protein [Longimicrobium sp.]
MKIPTLAARAGAAAALALLAACDGSSPTAGRPADETELTSSASPGPPLRWSAPPSPSTPCGGRTAWG